MPDIANSFSKGFGLTDNLMKQILERNQLKQQAEQFKQELALKKQQESRLGANSDLIRKNLQQTLLEHELKTNPQKLFAFIQAIKQQGAGAQNNAAPSQGTNQSGAMPTEQLLGGENQGGISPFQGKGMPSIEQLQQPQAQEQHPTAAQPIAPEQAAGGIFSNLTPDQQAMLQMAGIKIPTIKEDPAQKRYADLQAKLQLESYKTAQKKALEEEKANLKNEATRQKTIDSATNDLPHLQSTLESLENMKKIASNNPDLFGHSGFMGFGAEGAAERFAKTTNNPNAGAWQTNGLLPIVNAESKMSSKGNQLALKTALAYKPNFSETQKVALSKLDSSIEQIKKSIAETQKIAGVKGSGSNNDITELNGHKYKKINGEWHELH